MLGILVVVVITIVLIKLKEPIYPEKHLIPNHYEGPLFIQYQNLTETLATDTLLIHYNDSGSASVPLKKNWNYIRFPKRTFIHAGTRLNYIEEVEEIDSNQLYIYRNLTLSGKFKGAHYIQVYLLSKPVNYNQNYSAFLKARGGV